MRGRIGLVAVLFVAGVSASIAVSRGAADTTPVPSASTTAATVTTTVTTTASVTAPPATTAAAPTTSAATTVAPATTPPPHTVTHATAPPPHRCDAAAVAGLAVPRRRFREIALPGRPSSRRPVGRKRLVFPPSGSVLSIRSALLDPRQCRQAVVLRSLSLFRGAITAAAVTTHLGRGGRISTGVRGLRVDGRRPARGVRQVRVGTWGVLVLHPRRAALLVRLVKRHGGLPAGTALSVAVAAPRATSSTVVQMSFRHTPAAKRRRRPPRVHGPLKVTPPLGGRGYVFPVLGSPAFGDGYGAFRADVSGNWHHGDDIFAPLGTPVVAIATGTLNRVGWEEIGGWRLWVRDRSGNEFYYAHLSGYSPLALHERRVRAGEVIGFVGNSGDAFTTPAHLHFEIHPHQLIWRAYDGAVDPTGYLEHWRHVERAHAPKPAVPSPPAGDPGREARYVFGELLAARGLRRHVPASPPKIRLAGRDRGSQPLETAEVRRATPATAVATVPIRLVTLSAALAASIVAAAVRLWRLRPSRTSRLRR